MLCLAALDDRPQTLQVVPMDGKQLPTTLANLVDERIDIGGHSDLNGGHSRPGRPYRWRNASL